VRHVSLPLVLAWGWLACSPSPFRADSAERSESRGAAPAPHDVITVRYWVAGCSVSEDLWRYRRESKTVTCDARGRTLEGGQGALVWPDYVAADEIDTVIVEGEGLDRLELALWWSADDTFTPRRSVAAAGVGSSGSTPGSTAGAGSRAVRFELAGSPEWKGRVRRFQLTWTGRPSPASRIFGARGTQRVAPSGAGP
jgi:hypothetical protein